MTRNRPPPLVPPGERKGLFRSGLEAGARILQTRAPLDGFDIYVAGLHCGHDDPSMQMEAHHFCRQVSADLLQCAIFDGNTAEANLIGIEYIVSEAAFDALPEAEKAFWHPHNYEVLSGQLIAPGLPEAAEHALMSLIVNSYGKTWHCWHTGRHDGEGRPGDPLPHGPARLMWSFNRDGEADPRLREGFAEAMGFDEMARRAARQDLAARARPQRGVDLLRDAFPDAEDPPEGVEDAGGTGGRGRG